MRCSDGTKININRCLNNENKTDLFSNNPNKQTTCLIGFSIKLNGISYFHVNNKVI